jgi:hypothetical protein
MIADRRPYFRLSLGGVMVSALALSACQPARKPPPTPPPPVVETVMPTPPNQSAPDMDLPDKDETGKYLTPNRGMNGYQALWHVRMALNVAALGCKSANDQARLQYNTMLRVHAKTLMETNKTVDGIYNARYGKNALLMREKLNTIVYNYFALPPAQKAFCETAVAVVTTINGMTPEMLLDYAPKALEMLEQPFQAFWEAYADYLRRLEEWRRRYGRPTVEVQGWSDDDKAPAAPTPPPSAAPTLPLGKLPDEMPTKPSDTIQGPGL